MKILKYILIAAVLLAVYITEPLWRVQRNNNASEDAYPNKIIEAQKNERRNLNTAEAEKLRKQEEKIGEKPAVAYQSRVPKPLKEYWNTVLKKGETVYEDICTPLQATDKGWMTSCQYKVRSPKGNSELRLDTYIIKNGKIVK